MEDTFSRIIQTLSLEAIKTKKGLLFVNSCTPMALLVTWVSQGKTRLRAHWGSIVKAMFFATLSCRV